MHYSERAHRKTYTFYNTGIPYVFEGDKHSFYPRQRGLYSLLKLHAELTLTADRKDVFILGPHGRRLGMAELKHAAAGEWLRYSSQGDWLK